MFYLIIRPLKRRKRANMNQSATPSANNSVHKLAPNTSNDFPYGPQFYNSEWGHEVFTLRPSESKHILKNNQPSEYYNNQYKTKTFAKKDFLYTGVIAGIVAVILIVGILLYRLMKRFDLYAISPERIPEIQPECHHPTCGQYCTLATANNHETAAYSIHHSFHTLNVSPGLLPSTVLNSEPRNAHINALDLPPSYVNSTRNSLTTANTEIGERYDKYDLPPSYSEALSYMSAGDRLNLNNRFRSFP